MTQVAGRRESAGGRWDIHRSGAFGLHGSALNRTAVFLQPAVGLVGNSTLDNASFESGVQVVLLEAAAFAESHLSLQFG